MTEPQISILDNGLTVASWLQPGLETAAVALTAESSSRFERMPLSTPLGRHLCGKAGCEAPPAQRVALIAQDRRGRRQ